jgi:hypothetical protein
MERDPERGMTRARRGRPKADPDRVKRSLVTLRTNRVLYNQVSESARANGRSISEEIESRLVEAYTGESLYGGPRIAAVLRRLAATAGAIEARYQRPPLDDRTTFNSLKRAWFRIIEDEAPPAEEAVDLEQFTVPFARPGKPTIPLRLVVRAYLEGPEDAGAEEQANVVAPGDLPLPMLIRLAHAVNRYEQQHEQRPEHRRQATATLPQTEQPPARPLARTIPTKKSRNRKEST